MTSIEMMFISVALSVALLSVFIFGWVLATAIRCAYARFTGGCPRTVFKEMLEEW